MASTFSVKVKAGILRDEPIRSMTIVVEASTMMSALDIVNDLIKDRHQLKISYAIED